VEENGHRTQIRIVMLASIIPLAMNMLFMSELVFEKIDLTVFGFSFSNLLFFVAIYRYGLFSLSPFTLRSLIYSESDPYLILDSNGSVVVYSEVARDWFGKDNIYVGCNGIKLIGGRFDLEKFIGGESSLHHLMLNESTSFQVRTRASDSELDGAEWFRITSTTVQNENQGNLGIGVRLRNVTELANRNEKIKEQSEVLEGIFRVINEGIAIGSIEGGRIYSNRQYAEIWGIDPNIVGEKFQFGSLTATKVKYPEIFTTELIRLRKSEEIEKDARIQMMDGRTLERNSRPITLGSNKKGRLWVVRDITEQLMHEKKREEVERQAFRAEKLSSLGIMARGIAHEFNSLLTVILGRAEMSKMEFLKHDISSDNLSAIIATGDRAAELTNQMLSYVGQSTSSSENIRMQSILATTLEMLETTFPMGTRVSVQHKADPLINGI
jgi:PAS domain-containing protein